MTRPVNAVDPRLDNQEIIRAELRIRDKPEGENYKVNVTLFFLSTHLVDWQVNVTIFHDSVLSDRGLDVIKDHIDARNYTANKIYTDANIQRKYGDNYLNKFLLYENITLRKGKWYGAIIDICYKDDIWRSLGYTIYIGSIVVSYVYTSTDWLLPSDDIDVGDVGIVGGATPHEVLEDDNEATYIESNGYLAGEKYCKFNVDDCYIPDTYTSWFISNFTFRVKYKTSGTGALDGIKLHINGTMKTWAYGNKDYSSSYAYYTHDYPSNDTEYYNNTWYKVAISDWDPTHPSLMSEFAVCYNINNTNEQIVVSTSVTDSGSSSGSADKILAQMIDLGAILLFILDEEYREIILWVLGTISALLTIVIVVKREIDKARKLRNTPNYKINKGISRIQKANTAFWKKLKR
jgi:hypothetical protein